MESNKYFINERGLRTKSTIYRWLKKESDRRTDDTDTDSDDEVCLPTDCNMCTPSVMTIYCIDL